MSEDLHPALLQTLAMRPTRWLRSCAPATPLPAQRDIFGRAIRMARVLSLPLPRRYTVEWRHGGPHLQHGETTVEADGRLVVRLNVDIGPEDLLECALHELQHLSDYLDERLRRLPRAEKERRAIAFVARAMGRA